MRGANPTQLVLGVSLQDEAKFDNFLRSSANSQIIDPLQSSDSAQQLVYLWGAPGSGRTHLLQALCHQQTEQGNSVLFLPGKERDQYGVEMLQGANTLSMVCIDDVDNLAGDPAWEAELFKTYNAVLETDTRLLVSASCPPQQLSVELPDLQSRLQSFLIFQLQEPDDEEQKDILCFRAEKRGIKLDSAVAEFIVMRSERSMPALMGILEKLDQISLEQGRRVTIPLVKEIMNW